jgi:hypothetical protein
MCENQSEENVGRRFPEKYFEQKSVKGYVRHFRITAMMRSRSESVIAVPDGKQRPRLNKSLTTSPPTALALCF